jgi:predicted transcriptional regulator
MASSSSSSGLSRRASGNKRSVATTELAFSIDLLDARSNGAYSSLLTALQTQSSTAEALKEVVKRDLKTVLQMLSELSKLGCVQGDAVGGEPVSLTDAVKDALLFLARNTLDRAAAERALAPASLLMPCSVCKMQTSSRCARCRVVPFCTSFCYGMSEHNRGTLTGVSMCGGDFTVPEVNGLPVSIIDLTVEKELDNKAAATAAPPRYRRPRVGGGRGRGRGGRAMSWMEM